MNKILAGMVLALVTLALGGLATAEDGTWTGYIADEACAKDYDKASADGHAACAKGCVSRGGNWALAMTDGMVVLEIEKSTAEEHLGKKVTVKGALDGETNTVKVASVEAAE